MAVINDVVADAVRGSAISQKVVSPKSLAHVVLRTNNLARMRRYYLSFLGATVVFENDRIVFITYDDEHHRIALIQRDDLADNPLNTNGLEHIAFTFGSLQELCTAYKQRKALGMTPAWCVNHGPTTSIYYTDPDGNRIETQVDNFDTAEEATASMLTASFAENAMGADFDPDELCRRVEAGEDDATLKMRKDVGPRGTYEDVVAIMAKFADSKTGV